MIDDTSDTSRRREYTATAGQTEFDYPFKVFSAEDLVVYVNDVLQTLTSNYVVTGVGNDTGGLVTFVAALNAADEVLIYTETLIERSSDYQQNGPWTSARLNEEFDRGVVIDQEQRHYLRRTLRGSILEGEVNALPAIASRASQYLYFDANGQPIAASGAPSDPLTIRAQIGTATAGQTEINTTYAYTPGLHHLALYINGERQVLGIDYTETDSDTVTVAVPMVESDVYFVEIGEVRDVTLLTPVKRRERQVMTGGATDIVLTSNTYVPNNNEIEVFLNGALLEPGVHYTELNATTVRLLVASQENDEATVIIGQGFDPLNGIATAVFPLSAREIAAGVTPSDLTYPWGNVFRYGCVNDGVTVDTVSFTQALSAHPGEFHVPYTGTTYIIGKLAIPANSRVRLDPGVVLQDSGALLTTEAFISTAGSSIVVDAVGATVTMNNNYAASSSSRHGFAITHSSVTVRGLSVSACDMDGFHIDANAARCHLDGVSATSNRRTGIRVVSSRGVVLQDVLCSGTSGVGEEAGIAVVPDGTSGDYLEGLRIVRPRTRANNKAGILVSLENWDSAASEIDIHIDEAFSFGDALTSGSASDRPGGIVIRRVNDAPAVVRGHVTVSKPTIINSGYTGLSLKDWDYLGPKVTVDRPIIINANQLDSTDAFLGSAISFLSGSAYTGALGGVSVLSPTVLDYDGNLAANTCSAVYINGIWRTGAVTDLDTNSASPFNVGEDEISTDFRITFHKPPRVQLTSTPLAITASANGTVYHNTSQAADREVDLPDCEPAMVEAQTEYEFEVNAAFYITLDPNGTQQIRPGSTGAGKYLRSNTVGSRLRIRAGADGFWHIVNQVGTWAFEP